TENHLQGAERQVCRAEGPHAGPLTFLDPPNSPRLGSGRVPVSGRAPYNGAVASKRQIMIGSLPVGGGAPVAVQTMTKTETANLPATIEQIGTVAEAGADIVRVAVPREQDAEALKTIVAQAPIPVIADIH